jgi:hypothetical protein
MRCPVFFFSLCLCCLQLDSQVDDSWRGVNGLRFMFYNVENLFDPFNDTLKRDDDFTPEGDKRWTWRRMQYKCGNIARVMIAAGGWEGLEMVGLCEVENPLVIRQLVQHPLLRPYGYKYVVTSSPDRRGINLAFLYRPEKVLLLTYRAIAVTDPDRPDWVTRDILYVKLLTLYNDTLHLFLNHWPSRWGGKEQSASRRALAAAALRTVTDSLMALPFPAYILISGDFNDEPSDTSMRFILGASPPGSGDSTGLINLTWPLYLKGEGTHAHRHPTGILYSMIDQVVVSGNMLSADAKISATYTTVGRFPFLLHETAAGAEVPHRTYVGPRYQGGFSDHLPVILDLSLQ